MSLRERSAIATAAGRALWGRGAVRRGRGSSGRARGRDGAAGAALPPANRGGRFSRAGRRHRERPVSPRGGERARPGAAGGEVAGRGALRPGGPGAVGGRWRRPRPAPGRLLSAGSTARSGRHGRGEGGESGQGPWGVRSPRYPPQKNRGQILPRKQKHFLGVEVPGRSSDDRSLRTFGGAGSWQQSRDHQGPVD